LLPLMAMQAINELLIHQSSVLLIAPTGWGKTTLLLDLIANSNKKWVYLAPLRALANEFYARISKKVCGTFLISHHHEVKTLIQNGIDFKLLVITPELVSEDLLNWMDVTTHFVLDELHLFYYWGDAFRPRLYELYLDVQARNFPILALSATMSENLLLRWHQDAQYFYEENFCINIANHKLKKEPSSYYYIPAHFKNLVWENLLNTSTSNSKLIFCAYREEVEQKKKFLLSRGKQVVSCIGGETLSFSAELAKIPNPEFILATSAISHGVNLPKISVVFISYKVKNFDFWVQMLGRGGRLGEDFVAISCERYRQNLKSFVRSFLYLLFIKIKNKINFYAFRRNFNS
jgi:ATP-dependent DNA helicase RecQ